MGFPDQQTPAPICLWCLSYEPPSRASPDAWGSSHLSLGRKGNACRPALTPSFPQDRAHLRQAVPVCGLLGPALWRRPACQVSCWSPPAGGSSPSQPHTGPADQLLPKLLESSKAVWVLVLGEGRVRTVIPFELLNVGAWDVPPGGILLCIL